MGVSRRTINAIETGRSLPSLPFALQGERGDEQVGSAQGDPNETLSLACALFGLSFIAGIVWLARRS